MSLVWTCKGTFISAVRRPAPNAHIPQVKRLLQGGTLHWSRQNVVTSQDVGRPLGELLCARRLALLGGGSCPRAPPPCRPSPSAPGTPPLELPLGLTCAHPGSHRASLFIFLAMKRALWMWKGSWTSQNRGSMNTPGQPSQSLAKAQLRCFRLNWLLL